MTPQKRLTSEKFREKFGLEINAPVFTTSVVLIFTFVIISIVFSESMESIFGAVQAAISVNAGWFYILVVNAMLLFAVYLMFSRFGKIRLGGPEAEPEFSTWAWLAMLFSAGMGIGLVFWSVAEPIFHYSEPPTGEAMTTESAKEAMRLTFYHWGFHPWGIYAVPALSLAFFSYNRGLPLTMRSAFYPLFGNKIYGPIGHTIDIISVVATLFGVATSLGLGVQQILAGLDRLFALGTGSIQQVVLIAIVTAAATLSVVMGLDGGIRRVSEANLYMAGGLLLLVFILGPTLFLLNAYVQNVGSYLQQLPRLSTWTEAYADEGWQDSWTIFYWGWWISWAPFVGMFIAQISRGRTIREFLIGVLFAPTLLTFFWMTVFGDTAIFLDQQLEGAITAVVREDVSTALFVLLEQFPLAWLSSFVAVMVVVLFFVTSSDSGSLVIDVITAGGNTDPPVGQRIFWAITEGVVAAVLLLAGGLAALQTAAITTALPFCIVLILMAVSLYKGLQERMEEDVDVGSQAKRVSAPPGQVGNLAAPHHGKNWVVLDWNAPEEGGAVAAYRIRRRLEGEEQWHEVAMCLEESAALHHKDGKKKFEYQVVPVNRAGEGSASPLVKVDFSMPHTRGRPILPGGT